MNGMKNARANSVNAWRTLPRLRRFVLPHWPAVACAVVLMMVEAAMDLLKPFPLKWTLDVILKQRDLTGETLYLLLGLSISLVVIAVVDGLSHYLSTFYLNRAGRTVVFDLRTALFDHIQRVSLQFHNRRSAGDLMTRVTSDVKGLKDAMTESVAEILHSVIFVIGMGAVLLWLDWRLTLVFVAAVPILLVALSVYVSRAEERSHELLDVFGLSGRAEAYPNQLSGGQRQRVAIARACALDAPVILADEPTASLDTSSGWQVTQVFRQLADRERRAVVFVTHDNRLTEVANRIVTIEDGRIVSETAGNIH